MRIRYRYLLAGVAWALFFAPAAAYFVLAGVAGVLWLYIIGDNPWPSATEWVLLTTGLVVFVSTAAGCMYVAYRYGRNREIEAGEDGGREWRRVLLWTLVPLGLIAITAVAFWQRSIHQAEILAAMEQREAVFADLLNTRQTISELTARATDSGDLQAILATSGGRSGTYRLLWQVNSMTYGEILSDEKQAVEIGSAREELVLEILIDDLARSYRDTVLKGGGVLVDEPFELFVTLVPDVDEQDIEAWPPRERYQWEQGVSPLFSIRSFEFPMRFSVSRDGTINYPGP